MGAVCYSGVCIFCKCLAVVTDYAPFCPMIAVAVKADHQTDDFLFVFTFYAYLFIIHTHLFGLDVANLQL